ncbi:MAG: hypothetical protein HY075_15740 [Deltaproteobacteria bacterium]|nr:hypothetical protein [Deltaproteobacteria bacterium]
MPRFEVGMMWNARGWVNTPDTVHFMALPIAMKFPIELEKDVELELGLGGEPEFTLFGADPHKYFMMGVFGTVGISVDFKAFVFDFDLRYNVGLDDVSSFYPGSRSRDVQVLAGLLWHF